VGPRVGHDAEEKRKSYHAVNGTRSVQPIARRIPTELAKIGKGNICDL
jgi:hypothetical protein